MDYFLSSNASPVGTCNRMIFSQHNSVTEFEKRKNRIESLISYYDAISFDCYSSPDDTQAKMNFPIQRCVLEIWFTRDAILRSLDKAQKKQVVSLLLQKYKQKSDGMGTLTAMAWIMYDDQYSPVVSYYGNISSNEYFMVREDEINDVIVFAENYTH
jgi:hypothetical protein